MATTSTRIANGILQNAQSAFNPHNGTAGNRVIGKIDKETGRLTPTGYGIGGGKTRGIMPKIQEGITDLAPTTPVAKTPVDDTRLTSAMLPGVTSPGTLNVMDVNRSDKSVAATPAGGGPVQDVYTQAINELQAIIKNPDLARRKVTTSFGNTYDVIDRPKLQALEAIINATGERFKTEQAGQLGAEQVTAAQERNRLTGLGINERALTRLSGDIAGEQRSKLQKEKLFQEKLKLFSPSAGIGNQVNASAGLFRLALSGEDIPASYKVKANKLVTDFNKQYTEYLKANELEDTPENKQEYMVEYEGSLL